MTGFARHEIKESWGTLTCEIRSVNHRYLEPYFRLPEALRSVEMDLRQSLKKSIHRGKVEITYTLNTQQADSSELRVNDQLAEQIVALSQTISSHTSNVAPLNPIDILNWPGVIEHVELDQKQLKEAAIQAFKDAIHKLIENREREGIELAKMIQLRLDGIAKHIETLRAILPDILTKQENKLREKIVDLELEIDEDRIAQEIVLLAQKADVAEEIDRLEAHILEVTRTLGSSDSIGRRLDFLMQELNREANTLSSKSIATDTTQSAVELKVLIEQMREQIQNIE
jgi:uncharacterized protein (TIGR00255 family)